MPVKIKDKNLWLWKPEGIAKVEAAVKKDGGGDATVKKVKDWIVTTKQISSDAITKPIMAKYTGDANTGLSAADLKEAAQKEAMSAEITFELDKEGSAVIKVGSSQIAKKKLW